MTRIVVANEHAEEQARDRADGAYTGPQRPERAELLHLVIVRYRSLSAYEATRGVDELLAGGRGDLIGCAIEEQAIMVVDPCIFDA